MNQKQFREMLSEMPPLRHSMQTEDPFDIEHSEVAKWLISRPAVMQFIFNKATSTKCIEYDKTTGLWSGRWCDAEFDSTGGRIPIDRELFMSALLEMNPAHDSPAHVASLQRYMGVNGTKVSIETTRAALMGLVKQQRINFRCDNRPYEFWLKITEEQA